MKVRRSWLALAVAAAAVIALPAAAAPGGPEPAKGLLEQVSQAVVAHYWAANPDAAPPQFSSALTSIQKTPPGRHVSSCAANANKDVYNCDVFGLPQNEESITACPTNDNLVLGGTNDYRGILDPEQNFTGWHWSIDGGHSVKNEGLLPPVRLISNPNHTVPSGGDPVDFIQT